MRAPDKLKIEAVLKCIPGYNPWDQAEDSWLDHDAAAKAVNWFNEHLKHVEGSAQGQPFILRKWQAAIVGNIFGWKRKDAKGRIIRRYRKCLIYVPRGNGKTPLAAGIVLYGFYEDHEPGSQCYLAAGQAEQAGYLFRNARGFVEQDDELSAKTTIYGGDQHRSLVLNDDRLSFCKVIPADAAGQHGGIPHIIAIDELHVQESSDLLRVFETGMAKMVRAQPLLVMITTADYDRPSICNETFDFACNVRDNGGHKDRPGYAPTFLPVLYATGDDADWRDEEVWSACNPNIDVSVSRESLREMCKHVQENPGGENEFRRLHCNQRTKQEMRLISMARWDELGDSSLKLEDFEGKPCWGGLDLSSKEDLTSLALVFDDGTDGVAVFTFSWCPADKVRDRAKRKMVPYDVWAREGFIEASDGNQIDYSRVREKILELENRFEIQHLCVDPSNARETVILLRDTHGFGDRISEIGQTFNNLSSPTKDLIFRVKHGTLRHDNNPVLRWSMSNLAGHYRGVIPSGQSLMDCLDKLPVMPSKQSSADKIDPSAAIVNALAAKGSNPVINKGSVYETRGLLIL